MMIDQSLLLVILTFLIAAVGFNLWLSFRLVRTIRLLPNAKELPPSLEVGTAIPYFSAKRIANNETFALEEYRDYANVLVFLASKCPKCKSKLPEMAKVLDKIGPLGVSLWIITRETRKQMKKFIDDAGLMEVVLKVDEETYDFLNPQGMSPYYLFISNENVLEAEGQIGDENWLNFLQQIGHEA
ncbi:MAG: redoxin domain-containing protein [Bacteroidota bacterium]